MDKKQIRKEANEIINSVFIGLLDDDNKENWNKGIAFILSKIETLEQGDRGEELFIWRGVRNKMTQLYGKKFITKIN